MESKRREGTEKLSRFSLHVAIILNISRGNNIFFLLCLFFGFATCFAVTTTTFALRRLLCIDISSSLRLLFPRFTRCCKEFHFAVIVYLFFPDEFSCSLRASKSIFAVCSSLAVYCERKKFEAKHKI